MNHPTVLEQHQQRDIENSTPNESRRGENRKHRKAFTLKTQKVGVCVCDQS